MAVAKKGRIEEILEKLRGNVFGSVAADSVVVGQGRAVRGKGVVGSVACWRAIESVGDAMRLVRRVPTKGWYWFQVVGEFPFAECIEIFQGDSSDDGVEAIA